MTNRSYAVVALWVAMLSLCAGNAVAQSSSTEAVSEPARVIVKFKAGSVLAAAKSNAGGRAKLLTQKVRLALEDGPSVSADTQVMTASGVSSDELASRLAQDADVLYAVPDGRRFAFSAPSDPLYASVTAETGPAVGQWYLRAPADAVTASLDIERAWNVTTGSSTVVVAVLDTGVRFEHPDLLAAASGGKLLPGYDMISDARTANDGDGRDSDASDPGDWVTAAEANSRTGAFYKCTTLDPSSGKYLAQDSSWHGTQVSGLIGALTNNGVGMAGVAPNVRLLPVRVLGKCGGQDSDIIAAMRWAAGLSVPGVPANPNPARVINMSLGAPGSCHSAYADVIHEVTAAGTVVIVAAGNTAGHALTTPANCTGVVGVAALRHVGTKVGFSDLGPDVAISAPGGNCVNTAPGTPCLYPILTTSDTGTSLPIASTYTDSFKRSLGTSFSAPLVSGTAALILSVRPDLTPAQVLQVLQASARAFPTAGGDNGDGTIVPPCTVPQYDSAGNAVDQLQCYCTTYTCGAGMLDAGAALSALTSRMPAIRVVEYYWAARDHYFVTADAGEIAKLDTSLDWKRTGQAFGAYTAATGTASKVCRMYIPPANGDSHFFSASPAECATVQVKFPGFTYEAPNAFYIELPDASTGACPAGTLAVYRLWNNRADSNHRYTTSTVIRDQMLARSYVAEGYGPNQVAMCAAP
ncbi:MAG: S8 family peptidase [Pseudomonadota bacterium]|nr:S8 family peptidase [Pseudomonadota bacterium]